MQNYNYYGNILDDSSTCEDSSTSDDLSSSDDSSTCEDSSSSEYELNYYIPYVIYPSYQSYQPQQYKKEEIYVNLKNYIDAFNNFMTETQNSIVTVIDILKTMVPSGFIVDVPKVNQLNLNNYSYKKTPALIELIDKSDKLVDKYNDMLQNFFIQNYSIIKPIIYWVLTKDQYEELNKAISIETMRSITKKLLLVQEFSRKLREKIK